MSVRTWMVGVLGVLLCGSAWATDQTQWHRFRFFLHPALAADIAPTELHRRLALYVADLNTLFARQTIRRFAFDPATDVTLTNGIPYSGHAGPCADAGYEIWAHVLPSEIPSLGSYGGFMAFDDSCAGVAADLHWDAVHDRSRLEAQVGTAEVAQYWRQLHHLAHEIEHIFGAGVGEYYNLLRVEDTTLEAPEAGIDYRQTNDLFWAAHADYLADPLTRLASGATYSNLMAHVRLAEVTAAVINARVRWTLPQTLPDLAHTRVRVFAAGSGTPVAGAAVKVWRVRSFPPYQAELLVDSGTDGAGRIEFDWPGGFNNYDHLILVKARHPAALAPAARWATIYDAQAAKLLERQEQFEVRIPLALPPRLNIRRSGNVILVEWPAQVSDVVLQSANGLAADEWSIVPAPASFVGDNHSVAVPLSTAPRFFRLIRAR